MALQKRVPDTLAADVRAEPETSPEKGHLPEEKMPSVRNEEISAAKLFNVRRTSEMTPDFPSVTKDFDMFEHVRNP